MAESTKCRSAPTQEETALMSVVPKSSPTLTAGTVFSSYSEFKEHLDKHCQETAAIFVARCARSIEAHNSKSKTDKGRYPEDWKYVSVRYECKHYGSYQSVSTGKRKDQDTFKTGCSARLLLSANKAKGGLVLNDVCLDHTGHTLPIDDGNYSAYFKMPPLILTHSHTNFILTKLPKNYVCTTVVPPRKVLNRNEKFNKAKSVTTELATVLSEMGQSKFDENLDMLRSITDMIKQGKMICWFQTDRIDTGNDTGNEENSDPSEEHRSGQSSLLARNELDSCDQTVDTNNLSSACDVIVNESNSTEKNDCETENIGYIRSDETSTDVSISKHAVEITTPGKVYERTQLLDLPDSNLPFHLPCAIKRKGRPKLPKSSAKKRRLDANDVANISVRKWLSLLVDQSLVTSIINRQILIDRYAIKDIDDIHDSISDCVEDQMRLYFTDDGWLNFLNIILTKRSK